MKKMTLQHLALYVGADCLMLSGENQDVPATILGVGNIGVYVSSRFLPQPMEFVKPFLRDFSDLTDTEAEQLLALRTGRDLSDHNVVITKNAHTWIIAAYEKEYNEKEELDCVDLTHYNPTPKQVYTADEIMFFTSRYFDVFGFIQTNEAHQFVKNTED